MNRCGRIIAAGLAMGCVHSLAAQQTFELTDEDTWEQTEGPDIGSPEGQLIRAQQLLANGNYERAIAVATQWIERHPRHSHLPSAYLVRGDALMAQKEYYEALFDYEYIARAFPGSETFITALERELEIAKLFASGTRRKLWGMRIVSATDEAEELLIRIQERAPGSRIAEKAGMELADFYFDRREMDLAVDAYDLFIENYPQSQNISNARRRLTYSHLASFKGPQFDSAGLREARSQLLRLKALEPVTAQQVGADALITRIDESDAQKFLETARWYLKVNDYISAEFLIRKLVMQYPRSVAAADALRLMPQIIPQLPQRILNEAPDYELLRTTIKERKPSVAPSSESSIGNSDSE